MQDFVAELTQQAVDGLFRNAAAIPEDKLNWQPADDARSVLDQLQECAQVPKAFTKMLQGESVVFTPELFMRARKERQEWTTVEECEKICRFNTGKLIEAIKAFPDNKMNDTVMAPWGVETTFKEALIAQYWNTVWHTGQIAYIQRLLGDKEMH